MTAHVIEPGDWLGAIAAQYGFDHWSRIWDHPANDGLRELRGSPDLVLVGDSVQIPELNAPRGIEVPSGSRVVFTARGGVDTLRLRVGGLGPFIAIFGPVAYALQAGSRIEEGTIEEDGQELTIPLEPTARTAKLTLMGSDVYELHVGGLGPVDEDEGAYARLLNLGFRGDIEPGGPAGDERPGADGAAVIEPRVQALQVFQRRHGLECTGQLDEATRGKLKAEYGS